MSKALDKSINKAPVKPCLSRENFDLPISVNKAYCVMKPKKMEKEIFQYNQKSVFALFVQIS